MDIDGFIEAAGWWSYAVVFVATASETSAFIGVLVPGETIILLASAIAGRGDLNVLVVAAAAVAGGITGDNLGYALGRRCARHPGRRRSRRADRHHHPHGHAQAFLVRHGGAAVFIGRFIGFVRTFLPYAAGMSGMPYRRFVVYSTAASLVWGIGNVLLGYFAGAAAVEFLHSAGPIGIVVFATVAVAAYVVVRLRRHRRRRLVAPTPSRVVAYGEAKRASDASDQGPAHAFTHSQE
ncbi:DedA family protein [Streptomyces sp. NPDC002133]|uniref:DedA family protein n=1 Tax=Streptomyces sp. NPDC002133 TaxID=3154409 RepID=UPI00331E1CC8